MPHNPHILTKIIATVGPACDDVATLVRMIEEGVRVFRINFSHGTFDDFERHLRQVRKASETAGEPVAAMGDLCGPKIRTGKVIAGGIELLPGRRVAFTTQPIVAGADGTADDDPLLISTTFPDMIDDVRPGQRLLIDDGAIRLLVTEVTGTGEARRLICHVTQGGLVSTKKGINLPETDVKAPSMTEYDGRCMEWAVQNGIDFLALSFVRKAEDVRLLKARVKQLQGDVTAAIPVIAKMEKPQALADLDAIIDAADGVMVARGDLGVEMDLARVPVMQKRIIARCHDYGKPVIVATQMLQSMIEAPSPTRAEVSDVANAIYDGADAVMLSGETAVGRYPIKVVHHMAHIAEATEIAMRESGTHLDRAPRKLQETHYRTAALAHGVSVVVHDLDARFVVMWSQLSGGARYLSQNRLSIPIIAASSNEAALRRMCMMFGVFPVAMPVPQSVEAWLDDMDRLLVARGWAKPGDAVVAVKGEPLGIAGATNALRIHYVNDVCPVK